MKVNLKLSVNTWNMIISAVLWFLKAAGLTAINPENLSEDLVTAFAQQAWPFVALIVTNLGTAIYYWSKTWKTDKPNFLAFLNSVPFWVTIGNIAGAVAFMYGIVFPADAGQQIASYIQSGDWWEFAKYIFINILIPIGRKVFLSFTAKGQAKVLSEGVR